MKTAKKSLALFLAIIMAFSVLTVGGSAEDGSAQAKAGRFILLDSRLYAIDLSDQIRDLSTVNMGMLDLTIDDGADRVYARFDPENPGVVRFGRIRTDGDFFESPVFITGVNDTFVLTAKEGDLYDNVASYSFTVKDVFDSADNLHLRLNYPSIAVGDMDGDLVKTLTISYKPDETECEYLLDTVDMDKEIALTVTLCGYTAVFRAVPVRYENGVLTVALYDGDKAGVALHEIVMTINGIDVMYDKIRYNFYRIMFTIPEGLFSYGDSVVNAEQILFDPEIEGVPVRDYLGIQIPEWFIGLPLYLDPDGKLSDILELFQLPVAIFFVVHAARQLWKSFEAYGMDARAIFRDCARFVWKEWIRETFGDLFTKS